MAATFSWYIKDIYGTHAAARWAKEAGLQSMGLEKVGKVIGAVGPKKAGVFQRERKASWFRRRASGLHAHHRQGLLIQRHRKASPPQAQR